MRVARLPERYFRIAPELRRCCWYALAAVPVLAAAALWVKNILGRGDTAGTICLFVILFAGALALLWFLRWKLKVDWEGVSRRTLTGWDTWTWDDFASGRILKEYPITFRDPARPWRQRKLRLSPLSTTDCLELCDAINSVYRLPPAPPLPDSLTVRYGFRKSATFTARGIQLSAGKKSAEYAWDEVRLVHIMRMDALRRDFARLEIILPDREIEFRIFQQQGRTSATWRGTSGEEINEFLLEHVDPTRVALSIRGQPETSPAAIERKLKRLRKQFRDLRNCFLILSIPLVGTLAWMAMRGEIARTLFCTTTVVVVYGPVFLWTLRRMISDIRDLEARLIELRSGG